jgi:hypothetical protein
MERLTDPFDGRDNFPDNYRCGWRGEKTRRRFLTVYPWASFLRRRYFSSPLPQLSSILSSLVFAFPPLFLAPSSPSLGNFLLRFACRCHGGGAGVGEGQRVVALRQPWTPEERRGGGADRRVLEEERVPRREAGRRVQEIKVAKSRGVAGAGE